MSVMSSLRRAIYLPPKDDRPLPRSTDKSEYRKKRDKKNRIATRSRKQNRG